jgi:hypothetical protein
MTSLLKEGVYTVVKTVATPLRFFAVALVVLGAVVITLAWKSTLPAELTTRVIYVCLGAMIILVVIVMILVIWYPKKLTFDQEAHLTVLRERLGDSELPMMYFAGTLPPVEKGQAPLISDVRKEGA